MSRALVSFTSVFLCAIASCSALSLECHFLRMDGVLSEALTKKNTTAKSEFDCVVSTCTCAERCLVSFNPKTGVCRSALLSSALPLNWTLACFFEATNATSPWSSFMSVTSVGGASWERPSALWVLDDRVRGCNVGSRGRLLNSAMMGFQWSVGGPRSSGSKFPLFSTSARAEIEVLHDGKYLLNFTQSFSIMFWMRARHGSPPRRVIVHGIAAPSDRMSMQIGFNEYSDRIVYNHRTKGVTSGLEASSSYWRHFALTYNGTDYVTYRNGSVWRQDIIRATSYSAGPQPDKIYIGFTRRGTDAQRYDGSLACLAVFERSLMASEIARVMNSCP